jgi:multicomponent Na+:H+ antiporter subunit A
LLLLLGVHALTALLAPALVRRWGRQAFLLVALAPAAACGWAVAQTGRVRNGAPVVEAHSWVPQLGLEVSLRMGTLGWLMVVLVGGVGALVLAYCARYFDADDDGTGRFAAVFVAFAGAMFGLVVSDDLILLYIFWELTTVFSYLLIGHDPARRAGRRAAMQALLVTTFGGLAMLIGFLMLGRHAGSHRWSVVAENLPGGGYLATAGVLILLGALSKSAVLPFSFWLPAAMAAPTPVSAYLHAAAMVKAGVFLVALLTPAFAGTAAWHLPLLVCGIATMLAAGWAALRQHDLKLLLAYGTVSQLGLLITVLGSGSRTAALAGTAMLLAHALFKAALFLVVGIIDRTTGTRDLRALSGLARRMPVLAAVTGLAAASMAGLPPLAGFVGKEAVFTTFAGGTGQDLTVLAAIVAGSALTCAYTLRFVWGGFGVKAGVPLVAAAGPGPLFVAPAAVLAVAGLVAGPAAPMVDGLLAPYAAAFADHAEPYHLALWHGVGPALGLSVLALAAGALLFGVRGRGLGEQPGRAGVGNGVYERVMHGVDRLAVEVTGATQRGSLPFYLGVILLVLVVLAGGALLAGLPWPGGIRWWDTPLQLPIAAVIAVAAVAAARAQRRLTAMVLVGVTGYGIAALFIVHGAPDLALTQLLVETATIAMFVLVLRRLPAHFSERPVRASRRLRVAIGVVVGAVASAMAYVAVGGRTAIPISAGFADLSVAYGGGANVVNVILVDIRAWDTMGEISVLVVAATGVAGLIFQRTRALQHRADPGPPTGSATSASAGPPGNPSGHQEQWLPAGDSDDTGRQAIVLQVVTRLIFHVIVVFSVYLLFSGHNAPGGGFAGGLVAGLALAVRYLAGGRRELNVAAPIDAGLVLGTGLLVAVGTGVTAMVLGGDVLQSALIDAHLPVVGHLHVATSTFFDIGVFLIVIGLVLDILRSLGAETDRQHEAGRESS